MMPAMKQHQPGQRRPLADAAEFLGVSVKTLSRRIKDGKVKVIRDGRLIFLSEAECLRLSGASGEVN